ncbi:MAG: hypothetical protein KAJ95_10485 [Gammaproteobacteria bacterium]|nr:hypothetical protein [Gammaproteobacteria bacterium]
MNKPGLVVISMLLSLAAPAMACQPGGKDAAACDHKGEKQGKMARMRAMHHANPMPNLMMMVTKKGDDLNLNAEQEMALAEWREKSRPVIKENVAKVIKLEDEIMTATLEGADKAVLMAKVDEMLALRRDIAARKANCRDNLKKILNEDQYNTVINAYSAHQSKKHQRMNNKSM